MLNRTSFIVSILFLVGSGLLNADTSTFKTDSTLPVSEPNPSICTQQCQSAYASALVDCDAQVGPARITCRQNAKLALSACLKLCIE